MKVIDWFRAKTLVKQGSTAHHEFLSKLDSKGETGFLVKLNSEQEKFQHETTIIFDKTLRKSSVEISASLASFKEHIYHIAELIYYYVQSCSLHHVYCVG